MKTVVSVVIIILAAVIGAFFGMGMNEPLNGAILFATIAGFTCVIRMIEEKKK